MRSCVCVYIPRNRWWCPCHQFLLSFWMIWKSHLFAWMSQNHKTLQGEVVVSLIGTYYNYLICCRGYRCFWWWLILPNKSTSWLSWSIQQFETKYKIIKNKIYKWRLFFVVQHCFLLTQTLSEKKEKKRMGSRRFPSGYCMLLTGLAVLSVVFSLGSSTNFSSIFDDLICRQSIY